MLAFDDNRLTLPDGGERTRCQTAGETISMRKAPDPGATQISQVLFGETVIVHHREGDFALVQNQTDRYVGWVATSTFAEPVLTPTHRILAPRVHAYSEPSVFAAATLVLGRGALLTATGERDGDYLEFERAGWIAAHLAAPISTCDIDPASIAEEFLHTPYLWGGRDGFGLDCSGLVQIAFGACGIICPRDSDMQMHWLGEEVPDWTKPANRRRGDLIFWKGHVGILLDAETLLHANGTFMTTLREPLAPAIERIAKEYGEPLEVRRIDVSKAAGRVPAWLTAEG